MSMQLWTLPWRPDLVFTGRSIYTINPETGIIVSHRDVWDALSNNKYLSLEGVMHVLRQVSDVWSAFRKSRLLRMYSRPHPTDGLLRLIHSVV